MDSLADLITSSNKAEIPRVDARLVNHEQRIVDLEKQTREGSPGLSS